MHKFEVQLALEAVRDARKVWSTSQAVFNAEVELLFSRLLNEAAVNKMSVAAVAEAAGMTQTKVRALMRRHGLNPKTGRNLLAAQAARTLEENSALLGVEPHEFDLTSPLAYLPMGRDLRKFLETNRMDEADLDAIEKDPEAEEREAWEKYVAENHVQPGENQAWPFMCGWRAALASQKQAVSA